MFEKKSIPEEITGVSEKFSVIYNEALEAEYRDLKNVCGAGYKKALETLIKDYLIRDKNDKSEIIAIAETSLSECIIACINSESIQDCVQRAAWFGKDGTQYTREWKKKDLEDLKDLIQLTMNWIQNELLTERIKEDFPESRSKSKIRM